jgi:hypothetical protein
VYKVVRKVQASNELLHKALGSIDTPEKFNAKRLQLAKNVWHSMKETDSRECRNCHDFASMEPENQKKRSRKQHILGMQQGNTCIDCHKGIAHSKVHDQLTEEELTAMEQPRPQDKRPIPARWQAFIDGTDKEETKVAAVTETPVVEPEPVAKTMATDASSEISESTEVTQATSEKPATASPAPTASGSVDWSSIEAHEITLFYPGQTSMEWMLKGSDHGGKRAFVTGDRCFDCHEDEEVDIGDLMVTGEKAEESPMPDKRGSILVNLKAAYDAENLYMWFQWEDGEHAPVPFVEGGKMDPDNPIKLAGKAAITTPTTCLTSQTRRSWPAARWHHD